MTNTELRRIRLVEMRASAMHFGKFRAIDACPYFVTGAPAPWLAERSASDYIDGFISCFGEKTAADWNAMVGRLFLDRDDTKTRAHRAVWAVLSELGVLPGDK